MATDNFIFYVVLIIIAGLMSLLFSCLRRYYRERAISAYRQHHNLRQESLHQNSQAILVGILLPPPRDTFLQPDPPDNSAAYTAPPAYSDVIQQSDVGVNETQKDEELPPSYSAVLMEQNNQRQSHP